MDEVTTMRPPPALCIAGITALTHRKVLLRLVFNTWSQSSGLMSSIFACGKMPALEHSTSTPPNFFTVCATSFLTSSKSVTSHFLNSAVQPAATSSLTAFLPSAAPRAAIITFAPWRANTRAMPLPMPLLAPVTMTLRPLMDVSMMMVLPGCVRSVDGCAAPAQRLVFLRHRRGASTATSSSVAEPTTDNMPTVGTSGE